MYADSRKDRKNPKKLLEAHVTYQQPQQPQPQTLPLLIPSLFTVGWFTKNNNQKPGRNIKIQSIIQIFKQKSVSQFCHSSTRNLQSMQFRVPLEGQTHVKHIHGNATYRINWSQNSPIGQTSLYIAVTFELIIQVLNLGCTGLGMAAFQRFIRNAINDGCVLITICLFQIMKKKKTEQY